MTAPGSNSTPLDQSQKDNSAQDAQHGIAAKSDLLWDFFDNSYATTAGVLIDYRFMDGTDDQKQAVRSTIETSLKPPRANFVTWEDRANVKFREVQRNSAQIRISFKVKDEFWSALGVDALDDKNYPPGTPTMMLGGLPNKYPPNEEHRGNILHEFGHVLGLDHEHQSPTLEGFLGTELDKDAIIKHYRGNEAKARLQIIDKVRDPINYTRFDRDSIMVYDIKRGWQKRPRPKLFGEKIVVNHKLSELDQAFIRLLYPPDLSIPANVQPFLQAMRTAGVPGHTAGMMLNVFVENNAPLVERLASVRKYFNMSMEGSFRLFNPNQTLLRSINPVALRRSGVNGFIGDAAKNKLFQAIVKNIVYCTMEQYGIPTKVSLPGSTRTEVTRMLGALAMHDDIGRYVKYYTGQLSGKSDVPSSDPRDGTPEEETTKKSDTTQLGPEEKTTKKSDTTQLVPEEESTKKPDTTQLEPTKWVDEMTGSADISITKPKDDRGITMDFHVTAPGKNVKYRASLISNEESVNFNAQNVDVRGVIYLKDIDVLQTGTKARWTLDWVVFYLGKWDMNNFTAVIIPKPEISTTDLRSENEVFENVQWLLEDVNDVS